MNLGEVGRKALVESGMDATIAKNLTANPPGATNLHSVALNQVPNMAGGLDLDKTQVAGLVKNVDKLLAADPMNMSSNTAFSLGGYSIDGAGHQALVDAMNMGDKTGEMILKRAGIDSSLASHVTSKKPTDGWKNFYEVAQKVSGQVTGNTPVGRCIQIRLDVAFLNDSHCVEWACDLLQR